MHLIRFNPCALAMRPGPKFSVEMISSLMNLQKQSDELIDWIGNFKDKKLEHVYYQFTHRVLARKSSMGAATLMFLGYLILQLWTVYPPYTAAQGLAGMTKDFIKLLPPFMIVNIHV